MASADGADTASGRVRRLCEACVASTLTDGGSVSLVSSEGTRVLLSTTDALAQDLDDAQSALGEGPALDAVASLAPVLVPDLADAGAASSEQWPFFVKEAGGLGVRGLFTFPIRASTEVLGTLGLYRRRPGDLSTPQLGVALAAVDDIVQVLAGLEESLRITPADESGQDGRITIAGSALFHQASGMVMMQLEVSIVEAMALLRATAFAEGLTLTDLARDVVGRRRMLGRGRRT